jgi:hypothetical protein
MQIMPFARVECHMLGTITSNNNDNTSKSLFAMHCIHCIALHCIIALLHCVALRCCIALHCIALIALHCIVLRHVWNLLWGTLKSANGP